jgi:Lipocalin-like domain
MKGIWILILAAIVFAFSCAAFAQSGNTLVGTWKLVSASSSNDKAVYGANPSGLLTYTADGRMSVLIADDGRKPLSNADRLSLPVEEQAKAFTTFIAYAGRYTFTGKQVIHHVEVSSIQNWVDTDLTRDATLDGDGLTLRSTPLPRNGVMQIFTLVWERVK